MHVDHFSDFLSKGPLVHEKIKNPKNDQEYLFRKNGALHDVANGPN